MTSTPISGLTTVPYSDNLLVPAVDLTRPVGTRNVNVLSSSFGGSAPTMTLSDPAVSVITTSGTAVTAFAAGSVLRGGWISNPVDAVTPLMVRETGTAATTEGGGTVGIAPGGSIDLAPQTGAVSVNSLTAGHVFSGQGRS